MSGGRVALAPRAPAGHLPAGPSPQGAAVRPGAWLFIVSSDISDDYLSDLKQEASFMETARWKLIAGFVVPSIFFPVFSSPATSPLPQFPAPPLSYFLQRSKAAQCYWEANSPVQAPPPP